MSNEMSSAEAEAAGESLEDALNAAMALGCYLVAVWRVENGRVHLYRELQGFPEGDLETAQDLLSSDLAAVRKFENETSLL